ncbi:OmpA family protein [Flavihumibacter profundi]|uniref:OmpA family protein n=1 Tax=Flavihumibacter profundi TaxID=2716883 RepID=UPI001CC4C5E0|nr:OmpA family protein [Flavihumibacter profundi]MBZ5855510.1 OmpA family protein [Flavihumibacter profundi]
MKTIRFLIPALVLLTTQIHAQDENAVVSKFDFIPGEKIIFYDDFTSANIGDFPPSWNTSSSGEIVTIAKYPGRWLQLSKGGFFIPEATEKFTDNFTVEFDFVPMATGNSEYMFGIDFLLVSGTLDNPNEGGAIPGKAGTKITAEYDQVYWTNYSENDGGYKDKGGGAFQFKIGEKFHIAFWAQKQRLRMYANQNKILDLPRGLIAGYTYNIFRIETTDEVNPIISNFRIAAGLPDTRNKLLTEGKLVTYGIQFDVNSDKIKPESYATLKDIAQILKDNASVKIKIVGHTDSDGDDVSNLDLSKRRAASVKTMLNSSFAIDNSRMETDGKGETQPIAPNDNAVNKAKNRRVEFIKQ